MFSLSIFSSSSVIDLATSKALGKKWMRFFTAPPNMIRSLFSVRLGLLKIKRGVGLSTYVMLPLLKEMTLSWTAAVAMLLVLLV